MNRPNGWIAIAAIALTVSCDNSKEIAAPPADVPGVPVAGRLVVSLEGNDAGAVLVTLEGEGISDAAASSAATQLFSLPADGPATHRIAVVGDLIGGDLFSFAVPDVQRTDAYTVKLLQVANAADNQLAPLDGFKITIQQLRK